MPKITIYTDGGCSGNPGGVGGWAYLLHAGEVTREAYGRDASSTNNRMELTAAIKGLEAIAELFPKNQNCQIEVITDSQYLSLGMTHWLHNWVRHNWTLKGGLPVKNVDLWERLHQLSRQYDLKWTWVRGHANDPNNLRVDHLVQQAIKGERSATKSPAPSEPAPLLVKLQKRHGKPIVLIAAEGSKQQLRVSLEQTQKLIEDLIAALNAGEEAS